MRLLALIIVLLIVGCSIPEEQAEAIARTFVSKQVKFYANENQTIQGISQVDITIKDIQKSANDWKIKLNASSVVNGSNRSAEIEVIINSRGEITFVNGQPVAKAK